MKILQAFVGDSAYEPDKPNAPTLREQEREQYTKMRAKQRLEEEQALESMRETLDEMGYKAYNYARIVFSYSWIKDLGPSSAPIWANFFDTYFKDQGLEETEWTNMKFGDENDYIL